MTVRQTRALKANKAAQSLSDKARYAAIKAAKEKANVKVSAINQAYAIILDNLAKEREALDARANEIDSLTELIEKLTSKS
jgi:hypothetical protein